MASAAAAAHAGLQQEGKADLSVTPEQWAEAIGAFKAGESRMSIARRLDVAFATESQRLARAGLGKRARAEPVGLLNEQGRVAHAGGRTRWRGRWRSWGGPLRRRVVRVL